MGACDEKWCNRVTNGLNATTTKKNEEATQHDREADASVWWKTFHLQTSQSRPRISLDSGKRRRRQQQFDRTHWESERTKVKSKTRSCVCTHTHSHIARADAMTISLAVYPNSSVWAGLSSEFDGVIGVYALCSFLVKQVVSPIELLFASKLIDNHRASPLTNE